MANVLESIIRTKDESSKQVNTVTKSLKKSEKQMGKTSKAAGGMTASFKKLGAMFLGGAAIWSIVRFAKSSMEAFGKQEQAVIKLNQALKNSNQYTAEMSANLQKAASDIQRVTTVGDEDTLAMMQMGLSMGISAKNMEKASKQAIGLSKAYGVDLNSSIKMVALAHQGEFTMLNRYIPQLRALETQTEKAALMDSLLAKGFGIAEAETRTYAGQITQLKNKFGDLQEKIGAELLPVAKTWMSWIDTAIDKTSGYVKANENLTVTQIAIKDIAGELSSAYQILAVVQNRGSEEQISNAQAEIEMLKKRATALREMREKELEDLELMREKKDEDREITVEQEAEDLEKDIERAEAIIEGARYTQEELTAIKIDALAKRLQAGGANAKAEELIEARTTINKKKAEAERTKIAEKEAKIRAANLSSTLNTISSLSESGSREVAAIGKAAALAGAIQDTYKAATKALGSAPPPVGIALAAIVTAMGLANVAKITGASFKEGGPVRETGLANVHAGEHVLSVEDVNAIRSGVPPSPAFAAAGAGGGGINVTIHVSGGQGTLTEIADAAREGTTEAIEAALLMNRLATANQELAA